MRALFTVTTLGFAAFILSHCHQHKPEDINLDIQAQAKMESKSQSEVTGTIALSQTQEGVMLVLDIKGLPANSTHAFHVHEKGDCSADDATSAGAHFNPAGHQHGGPDDEHIHAGDMGNIQSDANGHVQTSVLNPHINLKDNDDHSAIGRSLIIHADEDQFDMQPSGNAGSRITCGVITLTTP